MLIFYIRGKSSLRIHSLAADNALFAAPFAPVAPQGEIYTLGEHRLLSSVLGRHARYGALRRGWVELGILLLPLESDAVRAPRRRAERRSNCPDSPQILTTIDHQNLFASKGSVW